MPRSTGDQDFGKLSVPEKILHIQDLWDQVADTPDDVDLTEAQRKELERRLQAHEENPGDYTSWEELRRRLQNKS
jgi:putative addiction module component (TIGR02574 family)